jgi:hypothetical protein
MLQIVKCRDIECCGKPRSSYFSLIPDRFLPPPIPITQTMDGLKVPDRSDFEKHRFPLSLSTRSFKLDELLPKSTNVFKGELPYDLYCPTVQSELINRRCKQCNLYSASKVMVKNHHAVHKKTAAASTDGVEPIVRQVRPVRIAASRQGAVHILRNAVGGRGGGRRTLLFVTGTSIWRWKLKESTEAIASVIAVCSTVDSAGLFMTCLSAAYTSISSERFIASTSPSTTTTAPISTASVSGETIERSRSDILPFVEWIS